MRQIVHWSGLAALGVVAVLIAPPTAHAYPIVTTEYYSGLERTSAYRDGYQANNAGVAYTFYSVAGGKFRPLKQDLAGAKALVTAPNTTLWGYNETTNAWVSYGGNGNDLTPHNVNYGWQYGYTLAFDGEDVTVDVQIQFDWALTTLNAAQQTALMTTWERNIEGWWNDQYRISKDWGAFIFDYVFDVTFEGYPTGVPGEENLFNQDVTVHPGAGRADMLNWYVADDAQTNAHEFGHMLGLFDEYWTGGIDTTKEDNLDDTHLMGAPSGSLAWRTGMKQDYYDFILDWMDQIDPDDTQVYNLIPEPTTGLLLLTGLAGLAVVRRRNFNA